MIVLGFLVHQTEGLFFGGMRRFCCWVVFFLNFPIVQWYVLVVPKICKKKKLSRGTNQPTNPPTRSLPWMLARLLQWVVKHSAMQEDEAMPLKARVRWSTRWCPGFLGQTYRFLVGKKCMSWLGDMLSWFLEWWLLWFGNRILDVVHYIPSV